MIVRHVAVPGWTDTKEEARKLGELLKKYRKQLDYYELTLERLTGKRVKEKIIYSFCLKEEIQVE